MNLKTYQSVPSGKSKLRGQGTVALLLITTFALFPRLSLGEDDSCAAGGNADKSVTSDTSWTTLTSCSPSLAALAHECTIIACADAQVPAGTDNDYRFVVSTGTGGPGLDTAWERNIELNDNAGVNDPSPIPVCTVRTVNTSTSPTFYWLARKEGPTDATMTVIDYSLSVICTDNL